MGAAAPHLLRKIPSIGGRIAGVIVFAVTNS
jgi:hypothetical protein